MKISIGWTRSKRRKIFTFSGREKESSLPILLLTSFHEEEDIYTIIIYFKNDENRNLVHLCDDVREEQR